MSDNENSNSSITGTNPSKRKINYSPFVTTQQNNRNPFSPLLRKKDRVIVLIDGSNTYLSARNLNFSIDWGKTRSLIAKHCNLIRPYYFTAVTPNSEAPNSIRPTVDYLTYNGFTVVSKDTKIYYNDNTSERREKGNMDVEITVAGMNFRNMVDCIILFSGDGDFCSLVDEIKAVGCKVIVVSTIKTSPAVASDEIRRHADLFVDLFDIKSQILRGDKNNLR